MSWYENNKKFDIDVSKIQPSGALAAKAVGDSFKDIAQVIDDREKTNQEKEKHDKEMAKLGYENNKLDSEEKNREATKKYLDFVDPKTGKFYEEGYVQTYGKDALKDVPWEVRQNRYNIENAYKDKQTNKKVASSILTSTNQEDFNKDLGEDINNVDLDTALKATGRYDKLKENKDKSEIEKEKLRIEKNSKKQRPAADYNLAYKGLIMRFGGSWDDNGNFRGLSNETQRLVTLLNAKAGALLRNDPDLSPPEAVDRAVNEYYAGLKVQKEQEANEAKQQQKNDMLDEIDKAFNIKK